MKARLLFISAIILIIGTNTVFGQVLTVDEAVRIALDNNLSLKQNTIDLGIKKRTANRSWNSLLPALGASAVISHPTSITGSPNSAISDVWTPGFQLSAGLTLSTSVIGNIKKAQADYKTGLISNEAANQEIELSVRKLFYQLLLLDSNRELATLNLKSAGDRYEQTVLLSQMGQASRLDELTAKVDMENLRPQVINTGILCENGLDTFKTILGIPKEAMLKLDGNLVVDITGEFPIVSTFSRDSLETLSLQQSIKSLEAQRSTVRNNAYAPVLNLSWTSTPMYSLDYKKWSDNGSFSVSLGLKIDNFLPWSGSKTQIDMLNDSIHSVEIQLTDSIRNRENRISQNIRTIEKNLESIAAIKLNVELAQSTYDMYGEAYKRGAADYQHLRNAGDNIIQAKNQLLSEQYNLVSTLLDLEKELNIPFGTLSGK